jgi:hydrogenase/urease accessory protein HupE
MKPTLLVVLLTPALAAAHAVGLSQGRYQATPGGVEGELTFTRTELAAAAQTTPLDQWVTERITVDGCQLERHDLQAAERDGVTVRASWRCGSPGQAVLHLDFLEALPAGHRHLAAQQVFHAGQRELALTVEPHARFGQLVRLGIEHILTGWDHLLFLFGMVLVASRLRAVLKVVTAFTLAHSLTLAAAALGLLAPSPRVIEPLIALSIAYVGIENLVVKNLEGRWKVAFFFGLLHGFGFAGGLLDIGASPAQLPTALLGFNLGVELGQLGVLAVLLPLLARLRRVEARWLTSKRLLSGLVVVPGLAAFVLRVASP